MLSSHIIMYILHQVYPFYLHCFVILRSLKEVYLCHDNHAINYRIAQTITFSVASSQDNGWGDV